MPSPVSGLRGISTLVSHTKDINQIVSFQSRVGIKGDFYQTARPRCQGSFTASPFQSRVGVKGDFYDVDGSYGLDYNSGDVSVPCRD